MSEGSHHVGMSVTSPDRTSWLHTQVQLARRLDGAATFEAAADVACRHLYDELHAPASGERACALVRCFKSHPYGLLEPALQAYARASLPDGRTPSEGTPCLALVASMGDLPEWRSRHRSHARRCLAIDSPRALERAPMWAQFFRESGVDAHDLVRTRAPQFVDAEPRAVNVFCVEDAEGAPSIPDQDFVTGQRIRSVFGFMSRLHRGDICVFVLFSRSRVSRQDAVRIRPLALHVASTLFRFPDDRVFAPPGAET